MSAGGGTIGSMDAATNTEQQPDEARIEYLCRMHGLSMPLRYKGCRAGKTYQAIPGDPSCPIQSAESCDACGQSIAEVHVFADATGRQFKTGCDCVYRYLPGSYHDRVRTASAKHNTTKRHAREASRIAAARDAFEAVRLVLASKPHPQAWRAAKGDTLADWCAWMLEHAGNAGKIKAAREVEKWLVVRG